MFTAIFQSRVHDIATVATALLSACANATRDEELLYHKWRDTSAITSLRMRRGKEPLIKC